MSFEKKIKHIKKRQDKCIRHIMALRFDEALCLLSTESLHQSNLCQSFGTCSIFVLPRTLRCHLLYPFMDCSTITVMTSLVALSFYGASQLKFHWVERNDKLLVGSVLVLVGILTLIFHDHDHDTHSEGNHIHSRKLIVL